MNNSFFVYDKQKEKHYTQKSSRRIFSENDLNTIIDKEGNINQEEVENVLNLNFEQDFPIHYEKINNLLQDNDDSYLSKISESGELEASLTYLLRHGIIGIFRNPIEISTTNDTIFAMFETIGKNATNELKKEILTLNDYYKPVKNKFYINFKKLCDGIIENMGECVFSIFIAPLDDFFILPDSTSFHERANLIDDVVYNGQILSSPSMSVVRVGYPINSRIFIMIESKKISLNKTNRLIHIDSSIVLTINKILYSAANSKIICKSEVYLKSLITSLSSDN